MSSCSKGKNILLAITITLFCYCLNVQALTELEDQQNQPTHFETTHELSEINKNNQQNDQININLTGSKSESPVNLLNAHKERSINLADITATQINNVGSGNLPAADQLNLRFELPPAQFSSSRQSGSLSSQPTNALENALNGYGSVRKSPQFPTSDPSSSSYNSNSAMNYQRQPQMISVLSGGASLHQSVSWNPPPNPQFNTNAFSSGSSSNPNPFNSFNSAVSSSTTVGNNEQFVPSSPPKVHESTNDFASHEIHVNSRPHNVLGDSASRDLSSSSSRETTNVPSQNLRQFENLQSSPLQNEKSKIAVETSVTTSSQPANKPKPAHTVVKNDGKKDDVVIYYYYYYDDDKNKTATTNNNSATSSPSLDMIPSLDQYDNAQPKKQAVLSNSVEAPTQTPKLSVPSVVPVNKPTEFKIDGNTFKFDTTGFTPITTTPASNSYNNIFRSQERGIHVHNNPLYGSNENSNNLQPVSTSTASTTTTTTAPTTTTTTTTTQAPTVKPVDQPVTDDKKPYGRRRFGGNPTTNNSARTPNSPSSNSLSNSSPSSRSNSNLASSRSRSRLSTTTTTTPRPRSRGTTQSSVSSVTRSSTSSQSLPPRRGFFSSRNRNNLNEENKPKDESLPTTSTSAPLSVSSTTSSNSGIRKFGGGNRRNFISREKSRDSSLVSTTQTPTSSRYSSSTTTTTTTTTTSSPNTNPNSLRSNSLRNRPSFSRSRQPAITRGVSTRIGQSSNKKDEPINNSLTNKNEPRNNNSATSDKPSTDEKSLNEQSHPSSESPSSPSVDNKNESDGSSAISSESTTQASSTTINPRARLFRSRPRSNLFGNRGRNTN